MKLTKQLLCSTLLLSSVCVAAENAFDHIIAIVNSDVITASELNHQTHMIKQQLQAARQPLPKDSELENQVLQRMVDVKLQLQFAEKSGVTVTPDKVDETVEKIAERNHLSIAQMKQQLAAEHIDFADYKDNIRKEMMIAELQHSAVGNAITLTDNDVHSFMQTLAASHEPEYLYHVEDILIPLPENPSPHDIQSKKAAAEKIVKQLQQGADFKALAMAKSDAINALNGGDLGWRSLAELPDAFTKPIMHLAQSAVAGPIRANNGFHVIKLLEKKPRDPNAQISEQQAKELLYNKRFEERSQVWLQQLRNHAYIKLYPANQPSKVGDIG